jgi:hypothetical protein
MMEIRGVSMLDGPEIPGYNGRWFSRWSLGLVIDQAN